MIQLNLDIPRRETRSATPGDAVIESILSGGGYSGTSVPGVLGACISRLSGVLSSGDVDPILHGLLPTIARQIVEDGEVILFFGPDLKLEAVSSYDLTGTSENRIYTVDIAGPSRTMTYRNIRQNQVVHGIIRSQRHQSWRGEPWRQSGGALVSQLDAADKAIREEAGQPRGSLLPTTAGESPPRVKKLLSSLLRLRGGLSSYPLLGRQGESPGPSPQAIRLQTSSLPELLKARADLSAALAESLGFSRVILGMGTAGQVSRPDGLRSWIVSTASAWVNTLKNDMERVLERPVVLSLEPVLAGLVPLGLRVGAAARLHAAGWSQEAAERLVRLNP